MVELHTVSSPASKRPRSRCTRARATPDCKFQDETGKFDPLFTRPKLFRQKNFWKVGFDKEASDLPSRCQSHHIRRVSKWNEYPDECLGT